MANRPIPSALNELRGNPGKRAPNKREPKPSGGIDTMPDWLNGEAKREWGRITKALQAIELLTQVDRAALTVYCQLWGHFVEGVQAGRALNIPALTQMRLYAIELGLTPAARAKLQVGEPGTPAPEEGDDFGKLLAKNRQN